MNPETSKYKITYSPGPGDSFTVVSFRTMAYSFIEALKSIEHRGAGRYYVLNLDSQVARLFQLNPRPQFIEV